VVIGMSKLTPPFGTLLFIASIGAMISTSTGFAHAQSNFRVLYYFQSSPDGAAPMASLIGDQSGNLYGTTEHGGSAGVGTVFKVAQDGTETVLHSFYLDGEFPLAPVLMDASGNLYGTLSNGNRKKCGSGGCVFKLAPDGTETTVYSFKKPAVDGHTPLAGLISDSDGNLYGTTVEGGGRRCSQNCGTVFKITPDGTETILHVFGSQGDGALPQAGLIMDASGNLYGTTWSGGAHGFGFGTVFKLAPDGTETILHSFAGASDGAQPVAGLIADNLGNLYGTASIGGGTGCRGNEGCGAIFKLAPEGTATILHAFQGGSDGANPVAGLTADSAGNLYGTTLRGGGTGCAKQLGCGTVFKFSQGTGLVTVIHAFDRRHGFAPYGALLMDEKGNLYGTAAHSTTRAGSSGIVFKIKAS